MIEATCPQCGAKIRVKGTGGRKPLAIPFKNICEALQLYQDRARAAKELHCSEGYLYQVLKEHGMTMKDVIEAKAKERKTPA